MTTNTAPTNTDTFVHSTKGPIRFENLHPGSFFEIFAEPSRQIRRSNDKRVYRRARDHEGFYSVNIATKEAVILMPQDLVRPLRKAK